MPRSFNFFSGFSINSASRSCVGHVRVRLRATGVIDLRIRVSIVDNKFGSMLGTFERLFVVIFLACVYVSSVNASSIDPAVNWVSYNVNHTLLTYCGDGVLKLARPKMSGEKGSKLGTLDVVEDTSISCVL